MKLIIPEINYTFDALAKTITLLSPYNSLEIAQIFSIRDLTTTETLYNSELNDEPISLAGGVVTHTHVSSSSKQTNSDILQIIIDIGGNVGIPIFTTEGSGQEAENYESVTIADSAIGLTSGTYGTATKAEITLETAQIRVRKDGTNPSSSEGHLVEIGDTILLKSAADLATFKAIRTGSTSGVLKVTYSE